MVVGGGGGYRCLHACVNGVYRASVKILCDEYLDGLSKAEIGQILLHSCIYAINGAIYCGLLFLKRIGNVGEGTIFFWILPSVCQRSLKFPIGLTNLATVLVFAIPSSV